MKRTIDGFPRITIDPDQMGGKPCVRGLRVTVGMILGELASGTTPDDLLADYPYLERADIFEALRFGSWLASYRELDWAEAG